MTLPSDFIALSQRIGANPMLVQGPGGNTSIKHNGIMWIKASGTELAEALQKNIFVAVDPEKAKAEIDGFGIGTHDGTCRAARIDQTDDLRPSIETTFHALLPQKYVFHFHSVHTVCHAIAPQGRALLAEKLDDLNWVIVPYCKPGVELTLAIREAAQDQRPEIIVLQNHGVIVCGDTISEVERLITELETRLALPLRAALPQPDFKHVPKGWQLVPKLAALATYGMMAQRALAGSYYPDHVVFLGPALPQASISGDQIDMIAERPFPALLVPNIGVFIKSEATPAQHAMLQCLYDVLGRIPDDWDIEAIGSEAEARLLNWDAEKYRQALAARGA